MNRRRFLLTSLVGALAAPRELMRSSRPGRSNRLPATADVATAPTTCERPSSKDCVTSVTSRSQLVIEIRSAEGKFERLPALAAELVALKVDVILAQLQWHVLAAKQATRTIPIVFVNSGDPVASGLVTSLAQPGGNVTGLSTSPWT